MKQTAVDWLKKELEGYGSSSHLSLDWTTFDELITQAKAIEREQIEEAYWDGGQDVPVHGKQCEQYYNQTYKGGEQ